MVRFTNLPLPPNPVTVSKRGLFIKEPPASGLSKNQSQSVLDVSELIHQRFLARTSVSYRAVLRSSRILTPERLPYLDGISMPGQEHSRSMNAVTHRGGHAEGLRGQVLWAFEPIQLHPSTSRVGMQRDEIVISIVENRKVFGVFCWRRHHAIDGAKIVFRWSRDRERLPIVSQHWLRWRRICYQETYHSLRIVGFVHGAALLAGCESSGTANAGAAIANDSNAPRTTILQRAAGRNRHRFP